MKIVENSFDGIVDIFGTLSSEKRRSVLLKCSDRSYSVDQLTKLLNLEIGTTKKHLQILLEDGMIKKNDSKYITTEFGLSCLQNISFLEFLIKHKEFYLEHRFGDIPHRLLRRIGDLNNSEFFYGFHLVLPRWSKIVSQAKEYLNLVFLHPPIVISDYIKPKVTAGLKVHLLIGENSNISECNEFVENLELYKPNSNSNFEKRRCEKVQVNLIMSEKEACIIFPNNNGVTDMHGNFISKDPNFVRWCHDFFEYRWNDGEVISKLR